VRGSWSCELPRSGWIGRETPNNRPGGRRGAEDRQPRDRPDETTEIALDQDDRSVSLARDAQRSLTVVDIRIAAAPLRWICTNERRRETGVSDKESAAPKEGPGSSASARRGLLERGKGRVVDVGVLLERHG